jgi:hypothetical protein
MKKCLICATEIESTPVIVMREGRPYTRNFTKKKLCSAECRLIFRRDYSKKYNKSHKKKKTSLSARIIPVFVECICPRCRTKHMMKGPTHNWRYCEQCEHTIFKSPEMNSDGYEGYDSL